MSDFIQVKRFADIDLSAPFFDTLKADYKEFEEWFSRKADKKALIYEEDQQVIAFLYLKIEEEELKDIDPPQPNVKRLKVGTFKIEAHGTRLGERFMKKLFDYAIAQQVLEIYVTIFPKHEGLIRLFNMFGFVKTGNKTTSNGTEEVYSRSMYQHQDNIIKDFPYFSVKERRKFLLAIYPKFHSRLFADSILDNESFSIVKDLSHTNSIHKVYVSWMKDLHLISPGDQLIIYRTKDDKGSAWYRSVATSVCTVLETKQKKDFSSREEYLNFCEKYSVFNREELTEWWAKPLTVIKMVYNAAFSKRLTRGRLIDEVGINPDAYWGFLELKDAEFNQIIQMGGVEHLMRGN